MEEFKDRKTKALKATGKYCKVYLSKIRRRKEAYLFGKIKDVEIDEEKKSILYVLEAIEKIPEGEKVKKYLENRQVRLEGKVNIHTRCIKTLSRPIDVEVLQSSIGLNINGVPLI